MSSAELHRDRTIVYSCKYHIIFCPKYRRKVLVPPIDARLKELVIEKQEEYSYGVIEMEIMPEHVHLLLDVDPRTGIDTVVRKIKGYTAHTIPGKTGDTIHVDTLTVHCISGVGVTGCC